MSCVRKCLSPVKPLRERTLKCFIIILVKSDCQYLDPFSGLLSMYHLLQENKTNRFSKGNLYVAGSVRLSKHKSTENCEQWFK